MKLFSRYVLLSMCLAFGMAPASPAHAQLTPAEQAAAFKAAGFKKARNGQHIRCEEDPPTLSYMPGRVELADLNGDGQPEAWVKESSSFCYGNTAEFFVLLTRDGGGWRKLLESSGIPTALKRQTSGWPDIEVGGPGFGKFPVYRWNGSTYVRSK
jgi:hypothetical protein